MKRTVKYSIILVITMFLSGCGGGSYVKTEDYSPSRVKKSGYNFSLIQTISVLDFADFEDKINSGKIVAEAFMKKLLQKDYDVIESNKLASIIQAKDLSKPENLDIDIFREISELINIDALLTGTVTEYVLDTYEEPEEFVEESRKQKRKGKTLLPETYATVGINVRFIDIKTGNVVWMDSARATADLLDEALSDAVDTIINRFLDDLYE